MKDNRTLTAVELQVEGAGMNVGDVLGQMLEQAREFFGREEFRLGSVDVRPYLVTAGKPRGWRGEAVARAEVLA